MFRVWPSNDLRALAKELARQLREAPNPDPFAPEIVAVGSSGVRDVVRRVIAEELDIAANLAFPFVAGAIDALTTALADGTDFDIDATGGDVWRPEYLAWHVAGAIDDAIATDDPAFGPLREYLGAAAPGSRRGVGLAREIADIYDRYSIYRPEWILAWADHELGREPDDIPGRLAWQPALWKLVRARVTQPSPAERVASAVARARRGGVADLGLPHLRFIGVSALPPLYLWLVDAIADQVELDLFLLAPSRAYWSDVRTNVEEARRARARGESPDPKDPANPLLRSFGRHARHMQTVLADLSHVEERGDDGLYVAPVADSALARLQADVLDNIDPRTDRDALLPLRPKDPSVSFQRCHGVTRQVEVLRDELLRALDEDPSLEARDILVMTPDVGRFAPIFEAVFDDGPSSRRRSDGEAIEGGEGWGVAGGPRIPYRLYDLSVRTTNPVAATLTTMLEIAGGRHEVSDVMRLLDHEPVRTRFGLDGEDVEQLDGWFRAAGARWGIDEDHREREDQPRLREFTWRFAIERLALGVAMASDGASTVGGVAPFDAVEGGDAELLGRGLQFVHTVIELSAGLREPRALCDWLLALIGSDEEPGVLSLLTEVSGKKTWLRRNVLDELAPLEQLDDGETVFDRDALLSWLRGRFDLTAPASGIPMGAATFGSLAAFRGVPAPVICLIGFDENEFPRQPSKRGFDLMQLGRPRVGDPDRRDMDRYAFLEAVLSAGRRLIVIHEGMNVRTNEDVPAALPVEELRAALDETFFSENGSAADALTTKHPLQPFSPRNFGAEGPSMSYDRRMLAAAKATRASGDEDAAIVLRALPPADLPEAVSIRDLARAMYEPAVIFVRERLGIYLPREEDAPPDRELIDPSALEGWMLRNAAVDALRRGVPKEQAREHLRAIGLLPIVSPADAEFEGAWSKAERAVEAWKEAGGGGADGVVDIDVTVPFGGADVRVHGRIADAAVSAGEVVRLYVGSKKAKRLAIPWVELLAWTLQADGAPRAMTLVYLSTRGSLSTHRLALDARQTDAERKQYVSKQLAMLVERYCVAHHDPEPLFENSSWAFVNSKELVSHLKSSSMPGLDEIASELSGAVKSAQAKWEKTSSWDFPPFDSDVPEVKIVYGDYAPFGTQAEPTPDLSACVEAIAVWHPVLSNLDSENTA